MLTRRLGKINNFLTMKHVLNIGIELLNMLNVVKNRKNFINLEFFEFGFVWNQSSKLQAVRIFATLWIYHSVFVLIENEEQSSRRIYYDGSHICKERR